MNLIRSAFYLIFYSWTIIFFIIFSPVKFFSYHFVLKLAKFWTGSVIELSRIILNINYELIGLENIPKKIFLLASNHQSAGNIFLVFSLINQFCSKKELERYH